MKGIDKKTIRYIEGQFGSFKVYVYTFDSLSKKLKNYLVEIGLEKIEIGLVAIDKDGYPHFIGDLPLDSTDNEISNRINEIY